MVELLAVVAIIAILASLLAGIISKIAFIKNNTSCVSNLRQWGIVISQYVADNNDTFPVSYPFNDGRAWYHWSAPLVQNYILKNASDANIGKWSRGYGINGCKEHPVLSESYAYSYHLGHMKAVGTTYFIPRRVRIEHPSQFLMIADAPTTTSASGFSIFAKELIGFPHSGRFNGLYVDGHVESRSEIDPQQIFPQ